MLVNIRDGDDFLFVVLSNVMNRNVIEWSWCGLGLGCVTLGIVNITDFT